jgi:hypothetical protein
MWQRRRRWMTAAFVTLAGLALAVTPLESEFQRAHKTCEVRPQLDMLREPGWAESVNGFQQCENQQRLCPPPHASRNPWIF